MFSKSLKFRLTTLYSIVFLIGTAALYLVSYLLLSSSLEQDEQRLLQSKILQFWALYQTGRTAAIQRELTLENYVSESTAYFVRLGDRDNETIVLFRPKSWSEYDLAPLAEEAGTSAGVAGTLQIEPDGPELSFVSVLLFDGNVLQVGVSNGRRIELLARLRRVFFLVAMPFVIVIIIGGWLAAARALAPIKRLSTMSRFIIDTGSLSRRIPSTGSRDELDILVGLFNSMLERIETLVAGMRRSLDDVAHDLRTPMTRLRMRAEEALAHPDDTELHREAFGAIVSETENMLTMLTTLMDIAEAETGAMRLERDRVDLGLLVEDLAELYSYTAAERDIRIETDIDRRLMVCVDTNRIRQVFANLLDNAIKYSQEGGRVSLSAKPAGESVSVEVVDEGIGIADEDLPRIFDRLFRADRSRSKPGLGLGLGLVRAIVQAHHGEVSVESELGRGSRFTVVLPAVESDFGDSAPA